MADNDLPTRLHWPADPLDGASGDRSNDGSPSTVGAPARSGASSDTPGWTLDDGDEVALIRRELADLRHAVDDLADRVELRQLRASFDELRSEVIALRRVVVEWPELDQLSSEVGALRSHLVDLQERPPAAPADESVLAALAELQQSIQGIGTPRTPVGALAPIVEELGALREEVVALRRRIALRGQAAEAELDDAQLERIVEAVVERVLASTPSATSRRRR